LSFNVNAKFIAAATTLKNDNNYGTRIYATGLGNEQNLLKNADALKAGLGKNLAKDSADLVNKNKNLKTDKDKLPKKAANQLDSARIYKTPIPLKINKIN
jgi:hypothetical protein